MSQYRQWDDFKIDKTIVDIYPANYVVTAHPISHPDETWFLALRHGEFSAQVDKAVGDILHYYAPNHTPEITLLQNGIDHYVATQEIPHLTNTLPETLTPIGFGQASVLSFFVAEDDIHSGNLLYSLENDALHAHKIDHAESLNLDVLGAPITLDDIFENHWSFPDHITEHPNYQSEQICTLLEIANTPFDFFEEKMVNTITANENEQTVKFFKRILDSDLLGEAEKAEASAEFGQELSDLLSTPDDGLEKRLSLLETRHDFFKTAATNIPSTDVPHSCIHLLPTIDSADIVDVYF